jgi:hypothetical protein
MKKSKKRFYLWHFLIFIPLLIIINVLDVDERLKKLTKDPVEVTNYEFLKEDSYTVFDIVSGTEIGNIDFTKILPSKKITFNFEGEKTSGSRYGYENVGNHDFDALSVQDLTIEKKMNSNEEYWIGDGNYKVIMINLFSDNQSVPDNLQAENRRFYLIRFVSENYFDFLKRSDKQRILRKSLFSSSYEGRYAAIFFIDIPVEQL